MAAANRSPQRRAQVSEQLQGNQRRKGKPSKGFTGMHTDETRAKMSASQRARGESNRARRRGAGGRALKGKPKSVEHAAQLLNHQVMKRGPGGAYWRVTAGKRGGTVTGSRPRTPAQLTALAKARATRKTPHATAEAMALIRRAGQLRRLSSLDLLFEEDRAIARDAKAFVRKVISAQPHRRPEYTLAEFRTYVQEAHPAKWIAGKLGCSVQWVRFLKRKIAEKDGLGESRGRPLMGC